MRAVCRHQYGDVETLKISEVTRPTISKDEILVAVGSSSINPADLYIMMGLPKLVRLAEGVGKPRRTILGRDFAGEVVEVGSQVAQFALGDLIFGEATQTYAEFVAIKPSQALLKPDTLSFKDAGCVPLAGLTAYQALDQAKVKPGQSVLIIGASGGVGTFAVQIAKAKGGQVTGVCSGRNVELVRSLGADEVIDYQATDFLGLERRYDVVFDAIGDQPVTVLCQAIEPGGVYLSVGAAIDLSSPSGRAFGPVGRYLRLMVSGKSGASGRRMMLVAAKPNDGLAELTGLIGTGAVRVVVDRSFEIDDVARAFEYVGTHRARGKVALTLPGLNSTNFTGELN